MIWLLYALNLLLVVGAQFLLKEGITRIGNFGQVPAIEFFTKAAFSIPIWSGLIAYGLSFLAWLILISRIDMSVAYPMVSLSYILVLAFSAIYFNEPVGFARIMGVLLIITGVALIFRS